MIVASDHAAGDDPEYRKNGEAPRIRQFCERACPYPSEVQAAQQASRNGGPLGSAEGPVSDAPPVTS